MIAGQQGNARLGVEGQRVQASENDRQTQHREIDLAGVEPGVGGRDRIVPDGDGDIGPFGAERIDDRSGGFVCCPVPDGQFLSAAGEAAGMAAVGLRSLNNLAGAVDQVSSVRRQRHLPGPALKQGKPELALELPDLLAQRRLGDVQDLGGRREGPGIRDRQEVAQQADVRFHKQILWVAGETCLGQGGSGISGWEYRLRFANGGSMTSPRPARTIALTSAAAAAALSAAKAEALAMGVPVTVAVLDEGGAVKLLSRMDGAPLISIETATRKAYAAAAIGMPPDEFFEAIKDDPAAVASFATRPGLALIAGGLPVVIDGTVVAGLGVAGAMTGAEDRRIAERAAVAAVATLAGS